MKTLEKHIYENNLAYWKSHRGDLSFKNKQVHLKSDQTDFNFSTPEEDCKLSDIKKNIDLLLLHPWAGVSLKEMFGLGLKIKNVVSYMVLNEPQYLLKNNQKSEVFINSITTRQQVEQFSAIIAKAYFSNEWKKWYPWLLKANLENISCKNQNFYTATKDNKLIGTAILYQTPSITGIYAVATLPDYQRQGVALNLMKYVISEELLKRPENKVYLFVNKDTAGEKMYKHLGFVPYFYSNLLCR